MKSKRLTALAAGTIATALALAGCGASPKASGEVSGNWNDIVAAANKEGKVTIYSTTSPANLDLLKKAFEKKYPKIKLTYVRGTDSDILPKVEVEKQTGRGAADVHTTTDAGWIDRSRDQDYSVKVVGPAFENKEYDRKVSMIGKEWFLTSAIVFGFGWNTDKVPQGITSPEDILDPRLKGKIGVSNPAGIPTYVDMYRRINVDFGTDYVTRLAATKPRIYQSSPAIAEALASGEVWASPVVGSTVVMKKLAGAPVEFALPKKPFGVPWLSHVLASAPHANAAQVLANFLVTKEGQAAISANFVPVLPNIEGTGVPGVEVLAQDIDLPDPASLDQKSVNDYQAEWEKLFVKN